MQVHTVFKDDPIEVDEVEAKVLRDQGLLREQPAVAVAVKTPAPPATPKEQ